MNITQLSFGKAMAVGLTLIGFGIILILRAYNVITAGRINVPPWILVLCSCLVMLAGAYCIFVAFSNRRCPAPGQEMLAKTMGYIFGGTIFTGFAILAGWVSLFGDKHAFSGGITGTTIESRIVFGFLAVLMGAAALYVWVDVLKQLTSQRRKGSK